MTYQLPKSVDAISNLEFILKESDLVFVDSSTFCDDSFTEKTNGLRYFSDYSAGKFDEIIKNVSSFLDLLKNDNVKTIPGVTRELKEYDKKISYRLQGANFRRQKIKRRVSRKKRENLIKNGNKSLDNFEHLQNLTYNITKESRKKELKNSSKLTNVLLEIVKSIDTILHLKHGDHKTRINGKKIISDVDEKLVVEVLYASIYQEKQVSVTVNDLDIPRLLYATKNYLACPTFKHSLPKIYTNANSAVITCYLPNSNMLLFNALDCDRVSKSYLNNLFKEKKEQIAKKINGTKKRLIIHSKKYLNKDYF